MLRFSNTPFVFKEAKPNRWVYGMAMWVNRVIALPGHRHRIKSMELSGCDRLMPLLNDPDVRLIFVANHSTHSDVEVLMEAQRQCGIWGAYMAAHEVFTRNRFQSWVMQRVGAFSVNRENVNRQSIKEGVRMVRDHRCSLTLFPEGNVAFTNEQVMPFLDGASFMAIKAQKSLAGVAKVLVIPTSIRLTHIEDIRDLLKMQLESLLRQLADEGIEVKVDEDAPFHQQIEMLAYAILCRGLKRRDYDVPDDDGAGWRDNPDVMMEKVIEMILSGLEREMGNAAKGNHSDRARVVRSQLSKMRLEDDVDIEKIQHWDDQSILLLRVQTYGASYLRDCPSIDRCSETLEKLREDFEEILIRPVSPRHAHVHFGAPIVIDGKRVAELTSELEAAVNSGFSEYSSSYAGGEMMD